MSMQVIYQVKKRKFKQKKRKLQLRSSRPQSRLLLVPKQTTQDLATGTLRDGIDELDASLEPLVTSLVVLDVFLNRLDRGVVIVASRGRLDHNRLGDLPSRMIRHSDNSAVSHSRMGQEMSLELCRSHLQTLDFDQLLDTVDDEDVLGARGWVGTHNGLVTRVHPAVAEGLGRGLVVVEVSQDDVGAASDQLAWCVQRRDVLAGFGRDNTDFQAGDQTARGAEHHIVGVGLAHDGGCLCQTVGLLDGCLGTDGQVLFGDFFA